MNRSDLAVTILGLIATYFLPWPPSDDALEQSRFRVALDAAQTQPTGWSYGSFGRVRTGPTEGIQPTR